MPTYTRSSNYGYTPSLAWNATLVSLFGFSLVLHCFQAYRGKRWIVYCTLVLGALVELMGYAARVWSYFEVRRLDAFLMQIVTLTFGPVFFSAYVYIILGSAIHALGPVYSVLAPRFYFFTFIAADVVCLVLQAVGGGQAAASAATSIPSDTATHIMVAGIILQLVVMVIFAACGTDFLIRLNRNKPWAFRVRQEEKWARQAFEKNNGAGSGTFANDKETGVQGRPDPNPISGDSASSSATQVAGSNVNGHSDHPEKLATAKSASPIYTPPCSIEEAQQQLKPNQPWWWMTVAVSICSICIIWRGIFRSIELWEGWTGPIVRTEWLGCTFDGVVMVIAVTTFNVINATWVLGKKDSWRGYY